MKAKGTGNFRHPPIRGSEAPISPFPLRGKGGDGGGARLTIRHGAAAVAVVAALACAGCGYQPWVSEGNYLTYDHPFTEAAAEGIRKNAEGTCKQRRQIAIQTVRVCSLTQCTTSFQCIDEDDARRIGESK
jgi:hypothetical protein